MVSGQYGAQERGTVGQAEPAFARAKSDSRRSQSFNIFTAPFGPGSTGQVFIALPEEQRRAVCEEVRRNVHDRGAIEIEVVFRICQRAALVAKSVASGPRHRRDGHMIIRRQLT